ncbi:GAF domain-containing protein [Mesorhizobium sp. BR115XR7A]|uniref:GAF domain-containing protein n=1 Tax=Mesorhizobium sp. BR115XR7A TaxID=2876645 RepID=UPI001CCA684D|nr:GAF domain-containing protein [Mesorhizobium sp. BR115XR7A]MBZ9905312.1 GAF domain-containing protein [Mesorhizobium sp. BR115XR7A]MBZ9930384.1 GAF domain-containing protein [Mesorhizobium sp. BR1-1-5]
MRQSHGKLEARIGHLTRELNEALERETATGELLRVIASSPTDIKPVLDAVAASAARLCDAYDVIIRLKKNDMLHLGAHSGPIAVDEAPWPLERDRVMARSVIDVRTVQVEDLSEAGTEFAAGPEKAIQYGFRTILATPLVGDGRAIGAISLRRREVRPFSDRQIELLKTFADQAVIAISNVRLFEEVQARTAELTEALAQQTATADVLKVISRSAFDLEPVLQTLLDSAIRLAGCDMGSISLRDGDWLRVMTGTGWTDELRAYEKSHPHPIGRGTFQGRAALEAAAVHVPDVSKDMEYNRPEAASMGHFRAALSVPLKRGQDVIGVFGMARRTVGPFSQRQIELVETFADQAAIAIANVRLFEEVQARNREVTEALERETATGSILRVIAASPTDIQPVLDAVAESAARLCDAYDATIYLRRAGRLAVGAHHGPIPVDDTGLPVARGVVTGRAVLDRAPVHVLDLQEAGREFPVGAEFARRLGFRAILAAPLLREEDVIGAIMIRRAEARPFTDKQLELLKTFADQAVIAIENVRLFEEVQQRTREATEALEYQTATSDVLGVISRSPTDVQPVFNMIAQSAARLCEAQFCFVYRYDGELLHFVAHHGITEESVHIVRNTFPVAPTRGSAAERAILYLDVAQIPDLTLDSEFTHRAAAAFSGLRSAVAVPMLRDGLPIGCIAVGRAETGVLASKQVELLKTFADQAVIAIENVRLFDEVQARTEDLSRSLDDLRKAQDRLVQTEKLASLGQLTAGIAHEIKNPLNFVNNFSSLSGDLIVELREALQGAALDDKTRSEIDELSDMLKGNLDKVVQHGKRADSIVRNMLLHSRSGSGEHRPIDINAVVEESLNLAYHGARAEGNGFNIMLERNFDPGAGKIDLFPQEITRVLLNLISNGFYATTKRRAANGETGYEPVLAASTKNLGDAVEIRIRDNGTGIPPEVKEKMFNPFFTTKPAGEGTGLGLSLSHDIVVKQHAGTIEVDTELGSFTEFRIVLPRGAATLAKAGGSA